MFTAPHGLQQPAGSRSASGVSRQTVVVIAVVIGLVMLLAAVVVLEVRNKRRHKDLLGRVKAPLGDPDTTIVVASIQVWRLQTPPRSHGAWNQRACSQGQGSSGFGFLQCSRHARKGTCLAGVMHGYHECGRRGFRL